MSEARVTWSVHCDAIRPDGSTCPRFVSATGYADASTKVRARNEARDQGWRCDAGGDLCPQHNPTQGGSR